MTTDFESLLIDGRRLEVRRIGSPSDDAPTLVFLHEGLGSVALWKDFPDRLARAPACRRWSTAASATAARTRPAAAAGHLPRGRGGRVAPAPARRGRRARRGPGRPQRRRLDRADPRRDLPAAAARPVRAVIAEAPHVFVEDVTLASIRRAGARVQRRRSAPPPRALSRRCRRRVLGIPRRLARPRFAAWRIDHGSARSACRCW